MVYGILTTHFPPSRGGMQEHARGLAEQLAIRHDVNVFTSQGNHIEHPRVTMHETMTWERSRDVRQLRTAAVDVWITLNAGITNYAHDLSEPVFAFVYANDFINPWQPHLPKPLRALNRISRLPCMTRLGELSQVWRKRQIAGGLRAAAGIFAISRFSRDRCCEMYDIPVDDVVIVPPGIDGRYFHEASPASAVAALRLVTVSRLHRGARRKNVDGVLEAIASLSGEIEIRYAVIGTGDDSPRLEQLAERLGIAEQTTFLGDLSHDAVLAVYDRSDAFIMAVKPSRTDFEGFGMVYAEAAAAGLPSIATALGGIPDAVEDGVTGVLLQESSPAAIADGIRRFVRERGRFDREHIRAFARNLSAEVCTATVERVISKHLAARIDGAKRPGRIDS